MTISTISSSFIVTEAQAHRRLDQLLAETYTQYSRSKLQNWLANGLIFVDGASRCKGNLKVKVGSYIEIDSTISDFKNTTENFLPEAIDLDIIYSDEDIIIVNKPAGLVVHPAAGNWTGTLVNALLYHFPELSNLPRAGVVHRLDKDTTGLMVIARNLSAHYNIIRQLQDRKVNRKYLALVNGHLITGGRVDANIGRSLSNRLKMAVNNIASGKEAITKYKILKKYSKHTLLELQLETGRTHQIRVHMSYLGYPIVGDSLYGRAYAPPQRVTDDEAIIWRNFKRQALTAVELGFKHPTTDQEMSWRIDLPYDMQELVNILDKADKS